MGFPPHQVPPVTEPEEAPSAPRLWGFFFLAAGQKRSPALEGDYRASEMKYAAPKKEKFAAASVPQT
jgi:hypothetical protein